MLTPEEIRQQVESLTIDLIEHSLCNAQTFPSMRDEVANIVDIDFGKSNPGCALKNRPYVELYDELNVASAFNLRMLDGALVQLMYRFQEDKIQMHRLAFFPSPRLEEFQNNPEIYELDEIYADIINKNIVPFPIRFDYDAREGVHEDIVHPLSHLTLGQYKHCRIPVSAPLTPHNFISFILRNFYNTAFNKYAEKIKCLSAGFDRSITPLEESLLHMRIPSGKTT